MSQRPDTKARKIMSDEGLCVNTKKTAGHVPGHPPSNRSAITYFSLFAVRSSNALICNFQEA